MTTSGSSLKNEGNALFGKHNFVAAAAKYREAIALDDQNAILHANLSACHFSMKQQVIFRVIWTQALTPMQI